MMDTLTGFSVRYLSGLGYTRGLTTWVYNPGPPTKLADTLRAGFFADAAELIAPCDIVMISCTDGAAQVWVERSARSGVVLRVMARTAEGENADG